MSLVGSYNKRVLSSAYRTNEELKEKAIDFDPYSEFLF